MSDSTLVVGAIYVDREGWEYQVQWNGQPGSFSLCADRYTKKDERPDQMADEPIPRPNREKRAV